MPPHYSRIPELKTPDNIIIDVKPMQNALMERRKAQEFDINKEMEQQRLDQQASQFQQTKNLQERQFGLQEQKFSQDAADRKIKMIGGMAQVIDEEQNPQARQVMWQRMRGATPEFDGLLQKYGVDPNDHVNGPKFVLAQIGQYDPMKRQERESTIAYRNAMTEDASSRASERRANAAMAEAARAEDANFRGRFRVGPEGLEYADGVQPAGFNPTQGSPFSRPIYTPAQATDAPGVIVGKMPKPTKEDERRRTQEELGQIVQPDKYQRRRDEQGREIPTELDVQRYWQSVYGKPAGTNHRYTRDGRVEKMSEADDKTRLAIKGALDSAHTNIQDAREVLADTNLPGRTASHYTGIGAMARANSILNIAIRGVLHGVSGAQINIPEQQEYFNSFRPGPFETANTMKLKLDHLENTLAHIRKFTDKGAQSEEDRLAIRNSMREALGLKPLTLENANTRYQDRVKDEKSGNPRNSSANRNPHSKKSNDEILKELGIKQ